MLKKGFLFALAVSLTTVMACGGDSKTPVSPSPTPAVDADAAADGSTLKASAPPPYLPASGALLDTTTPNLVVTPSSGRFVPVGGLAYRFAVETQAGSEVYRSELVTDSGSGLIANRVPEGRLSWGAAYRWRARAELVGATGTLVGPWTAYGPMQTPIQPAPPSLDSPANGTTAGGVAPNLVVVNGAVPAGGSTSGLEHRFVIESANGVVLLNTTAVSGSSKTTFAVPTNTLQPLTTYRWRARAERGSAFIGPWSATWTFTTSTPVVWPTSPEGVVSFVAAKYPEYLVATSTLHEREVNMQFIRDRMIEVGICGGMDLAWNLKRGVGPRSTDALLYRETTDRTRDRVIDIAAGFDEYRVPMRLHWIEVEGPPGYDRYLPRPSCQ